MKTLSLAIAGILLTLLLSCSHTSAITTKGFEGATSTQEALVEGFASKRWALVIGVNEYDDPTFTDLRFANHDAKAIAKALKNEDQGAFDRVVLLTGAEKTSRESILFELKQLRSNLRRQDTFVLYFSGHGTMELAEGDAPNLYLVARDTQLSDLKGTGLHLQTLRTYLASLKPQRKVMILDNCFSGEGKSRTSTVVRKHIKQEDPWPNLSASMTQSEAMLMASTLGGVAQEDDALRHGTYTYYLLKALTVEKGRADSNLDGAITAWEAHDYARGRTFEHTSSAQVPDAYFRIIGRAELFLAGKPSPEAGKAAALVYAYGEAGMASMQLTVDGQAKGAFPRTMTIAEGEHLVKLSNVDGETIAEGRMAFVDGDVYSAGELIDELKGYRRFFGVQGGMMTAPSGPASELWGPLSTGFSLSSGYRMRGGTLRGLTIAFDGGWTPTWDPSWSQWTETNRRSVFHATSSLSLRRDVRQVELAAGWFFGAQYVAGVPLSQAEGLGYGEDLSALNHRWLLLPTGPLLWQGYDLLPNMRLTSELRLSTIVGSFNDTDGRGVSLQPSLRIGAEVGF